MSRRAISLAVALMAACGGDRRRTEAIGGAPAVDAAPAPTIDATTVDPMTAGLAAETSDPERARALFAAACEAADLEACRRLGRMIKTGRGGAADDAAALPYFRRACDGGVLRACRHLWAAIGGGEGIAADPAGAFAKMVELCDAGDPGSCNNLGIYHRDGVGTPVDLPTAARWFEQVCRAGDQLRCFDSRDARPASCEGHNYEQACAALADLHAFGVGGCAYDDACIRALREMACNGGQADLC